MHVHAQQWRRTVSSLIQLLYPYFVLQYHLYCLFSDESAEHPNDLNSPSGIENGNQNTAATEADDTTSNEEESIYQNTMEDGYGVADSIYQNMDTDDLSVKSLTNAWSIQIYLHHY